MLKFADKIAIAGTRVRDDGYLVADARVARTGIQMYLGSEVGKPDMPLVRVYRPESEVFSKDTLASFAHRPVTNDHPDEAVTADNWKEHSVGHTADEIARDGKFIRVPLMVADAAAIKDIEQGKRELSSGYKADLDWTAGTTEDGEPYDAVQRNIRANHVAIVKRGRAGADVRIGDGNWIDTTQDTNKDRNIPMRKIMFDGIEIEVTDQAAQAITKLEGQIAKLTADTATSATAHAAALATKDGELAKKDAEIDGLKSKVLDDAALDKAVTERADLVAAAKAICADVETTGKSAADIRKEVVTKIVGADAVAGKSAAYVDARFDVLVEDAKSNAGLRSTLSNLAPSPAKGGAQAEGKAWGDSVADLNSWRDKKEA